MKASEFTDAWKAFSLRQAEDGTPFAEFGSGVPPLKCSIKWGKFAPFIGGPGDGWEAREA
jgi:hypothetical protein